MTILIDTNVVLDILLHRQPWYTSAAAIFGLSRQNLIKSYISSSAITDIFYFVQKKYGKPTARKAMKHLLHVFPPATVTDRNIYRALDLEWEDFEDAVQFTVGEELSVDYIVTRNVQDFSLSSIKIVMPEQFLNETTDFKK